MPTVQVNVEAIEELPEIVREFATRGDDGKISVDFDKSFAALKAERSEHRADRQKLAEFSAFGDVAKIKAFFDLGKSPEEIADALSKATGGKATATGDLEAEKQRLMIEKLTKKVDELTKAAAEREKVIADANLRKVVGGLIDALPDDINRDAVRTFVLGGKTADGCDIAGNYATTFRINAIGDLDDIGGKPAAEYLAEVSRALGFRKSSTAGNAGSGNASIPNNGLSSDYQAAKKSGDIAAMIANAPSAK